jgi:hypothetical protein
MDGAVSASGTYAAFSGLNGEDRERFTDRYAVCVALRGLDHMSQRTEIGWRTASATIRMKMQVFTASDL